MSIYRFSQVADLSELDPMILTYFNKHSDYTKVKNIALKHLAMSALSFTLSGYFMHQFCSLNEKATSKISCFFAIGFLALSVFSLISSERKVSKFETKINEITSRMIIKEIAKKKRLILEMRTKKIALQSELVQNKEDPELFLPIIHGYEANIQHYLRSSILLKKLNSKESSYFASNCLIFKVFSSLNELMQRRSALKTFEMQRHENALNYDGITVYRTPLHLKKEYNSLTLQISCLNQILEDIFVKKPERSTKAKVCFSDDKVRLEMNLINLKD